MLFSRYLKASYKYYLNKWNNVLEKQVEITFPIPKMQLPLM